MGAVRQAGARVMRSGLYDEIHGILNHIERWRGLPGVLTSCKFNCVFSTSVLKCVPLLHSEYNLCCNFKASNYMDTARLLRNTPTGDFAQSISGSEIPCR